MGRYSRVVVKLSGEALAVLRGVLTACSESDVRVMTAVPMQSVAEPFIRLRADRHLRRGLIVLLAGGIGQPYVTTDYPAVQRALELEADALLVAKRGVDGVYDRDPNLHPDAKRFTNLTYREALAEGVRPERFRPRRRAGTPHARLRRRRGGRDERDLPGRGHRHPHHPRLSSPTA